MTLYEALKTGIPDESFFDRYYRGTSNGSNSLKRIIDTNGYNDIYDYADVLSDYYSEYPASPVFKEKSLRPFLVSWYRNITETLDEEDRSEDIFPHFAVRDKTIELVKALQRREGISKQELSRILGESEINTRSVQSDLRRLSPKLVKDKRYRRKIRPLTVGGYAVNVDISEKRGERGIKYYCTPNSVHPLVLLPNVSQAAVLLMSLADRYVNYESDIALTAGIDIWLQLTDYCKDRIIKVFAEDNRNLKKFIEALKRAAENSTDVRYMSEREMNEYITNADENLMLAMKRSANYELSLWQNNEIRVYTVQKISIFKNGYRAYTDEKSGEYIDFSAEDVDYLKII